MTAERLIEELKKLPPDHHIPVLQPIYALLLMINEKRKENGND